MADERSRSPSRATGPYGTFIDIPGGKRTEFPDGSQLIEGPNGQKHLLSEDGSINSTVPLIRQVQVGDLAQVTRHEIFNTPDTTSHTLHFIGGGVFSYLHYRNGDGVSFRGNHVMLHEPSEGVFVISGMA
jgi:hypothetical protein